MVDVKKIDVFFNDKKTFSKKHIKKKHSSVFLRFVKLALPSIAALLVALVLMSTYFKTNEMLSDYDPTIPQKAELEKLHAEETTFSVTDNDGKVSVFTADVLDETSAGSKVVKIIHPKGKMPVGTNEKPLNISSDVGFFHQTENKITLNTNVKAVYDQDTVITTEEATYDFQKGYGFGHQEVYAVGSWGKLWADGFSYEKEKDILYLEKNSKIINESGVLKAHKQARFYRNLNKIEAEGDVLFEHEQSELYADKMIIWFQNNSKTEIQKIEVFGNVSVHTHDAVAKGEYGIYLPHKNTVELEKNVSIEKDGHIVYGDKVITNTQTKVSHLVSIKKNGRVSGVIRGSNIKRNSK